MGINCIQFVGFDERGDHSLVLAPVSWPAKSAFLPCRPARVRAQTPNVLFNAVQLSDLLELLIGNWCGASVGDLVQSSAGVCPATGVPYILGRQFQQPVLPGTAVNLQDAYEVRQISSAYWPDQLGA